MDGLEKTGNWREIQKLTKDHNPVVLFDTTVGTSGSVSSATATAAAAPLTGSTSYTQQGIINVPGNQGIITSQALLGGGAFYGP